MEPMMPRGRGRGRKITGEGVGRINIENTSSINDVIHKIDILLLDGGDNVEVENIYKISETAIKSQEDMEFVVTAICNSCFTNEAFIKIGSKVCCSLLPIRTDSAKFRSCLMNFLQKEYTNREMTYKESQQRFLNSIKFFAQLSMDMKSICFAASELLLVALFDYLLMLLESNSEEHTLLLKKLLLELGPDLKSFSNKRSNETNLFENLLLKLREKIIDDSTSFSQRLTVLQLFEISIQDFKILHENVKKFYQENRIN